ncbi:MAG TPA: DUF1573 domain-containing protein [Paludibacter sp.]|nr:DUF1573 domain-containing protein [Paludibacter sp.]
MKKYSFLLVLMLISLNSFAQKPVIDFDVKTYDFGKINEDEGKATYVFDFINKGNVPLVVTRVQASCGCTTPTWTKEPIEPGKKGSITVTYNPAGRPGAFNKQITVYSNATEEQATLAIKGDVISKSNNMVVDDYTVSMGDIKLKSKAVQMNNIEKGKSQVRVLEIKNTGNAAVKTSVQNLPAYLTAISSPEVLKPNETGKITFTLNTKNCAQWGPLTNDVYLVLNGQKKITNDFQIKVYGNIVENFSTMTLEQKQKAPILEMKDHSVNLGEMKPGEKKAVKIKIGNKGINTLEVRRVINNNKDLIVHPIKLSVASGKSAYVVATVDSKGLVEGDYRKSITIQTNDPDNSFNLVVLSWKVKK